LAVKHGLDVLAGVIDSDYRGEIICVLINHGDAPFFMEEGSRIAQFIVEVIVTPKAEWADALSETKRGSGGFGSTGTT
jgi:dUTP pyrophosphatase